MQRRLFFAILIMAGCQTTAPAAMAPQAAANPPRAHTALPAEVISPPSPQDVGERPVVCHRDHRAPPAPAPRKSNTTSPVEGHLDPTIVQRPIRQRFPCFRRCYEEGLTRNPALAGKVVVRFIIEDGTGAVRSAADAGSELKDDQVIACIVDEVLDLRFPAPNGAVTVTYPINFVQAP
jgi:hypothetical protein